MNKQQKQELIARAIAKKFGPEIAKIESRRAELADAIFAEVVGDAPTTDREWVHYQQAFTVINAGFTNRYDTRAEKEPLLSNSFRMSKECPAPLKFRYNTDVTLPKKLQAKADKLLSDINKHITVRSQLASDLRDLLATCNTYKQLQAAWPEGEKLYAFAAPVSKSRALADPSILARITKELA